MEYFTVQFDTGSCITSMSSSRKNMVPIIYLSSHQRNFFHYRPVSWRTDVQCWRNIFSQVTSAYNLAAVGVCRTVSKELAILTAAHFMWPLNMWVLQRFQILRSRWQIIRLLGVALLFYWKPNQQYSVFNRFIYGQHLYVCVCVH